jgi:hypothetical protein
MSVEAPLMSCARGRGPAAVRAGRRSISVALLVSVLAGCTGGDGRTVHTEDEGPLSASQGEGLQALYAPGDPRREDDSTPDDVPWQVSFGANVLCVLEPGVSQIVLDDVHMRENPDVPPSDVELFLRTDHGDDVPFYSMPGHPNGPSPIPGTFTETITGTKITQACDEAFPEAEGLTELIIVVTAHADGAHIEGMTIDYTADSKPYALELQWGMILCGDLTDEYTMDEDHCG